MLRSTYDRFTSHSIFYLFLYLFNLPLFAFAHPCFNRHSSTFPPVPVLSEVRIPGVACFGGEAWHGELLFGSASARFVAAAEGHYSGQERYCTPPNSPRGHMRTRVWPHRDYKYGTSHRTLLDEKKNLPKTPQRDQMPSKIRKESQSSSKVRVGTLIQQRIPRR